MQVLWTYDPTHGIRQFWWILYRETQEYAVSGRFSSNLLMVATTECNVHLLIRYSSAQLPSSGRLRPPQTPSSMAMPSVSRGYDTSTNFSRAPPPPMMQRVATMPTPGQAHNPHSVPYHNVPAPVITHQPSHSGMSGATRSIPGGWGHCACIL